jgi:hypothetical protein
MEQHQFQPGQCWSYATRRGEEHSRALVLKVDAADAGRRTGIVVVHVRLTGLAITAGNGRVLNHVGHLPISEASLTASVSGLASDGETLPDFDSAYSTWLLGKEAGVWTSRLADIVQIIENGLRAQSEPRCGTAEDLRLARALFDKTWYLRDGNQQEEAHGVHQELMSRYGNCSDPVIQEVVGKSLINDGFAWGMEGHAGQEFAAYDEVIDRLEGVGHPAFEKLIATAMVNRIYRLKALGQSEEVIRACDALIGRFGDSADPIAQSRLAEAMLEKGILLSKQIGYTEALAVFHEVTQRFESSDDIEVQVTVARTLFNKAVCLHATGKKCEAANAYAEVIWRFGNSTNPELRELLADASARKARLSQAL